MAGSQPDILLTAHGRYARRAHGPPRRARVRGSRSEHIVACPRARARQQIKISQNSGTPVPNCSENGYPDCTTNNNVLYYYRYYLVVVVYSCIQLAYFNVLTRTGTMYSTVVSRFRAPPPLELFRGKHR